MSEKTRKIIAIFIIISMGLYLIYYISNRDNSKFDTCVYSYKVLDLDLANMGYTNNNNPINGCIETTTRKFCGTMSFMKTQKGSDYCKKN